MADITETLDNVTTTPEHAAENLEAATKLNVDAGTVAENREGLKPVMNRKTQVTRELASQMQESPQKAAAIAPDVEQMDWASRMGSYASKQMRASDVSRKRAEVALKVMDLRAAGKEPTEADIMDLELLRDEGDEIGSETEKLNLNWVSQGIGYIPVALSDTFKDIQAQWETVAGATAAGAGASAVFGPGAIAGAGAGFFLGQAAAGGIENFKRFRGEVYDDLSIAAKDGVPLNLSEESKRNISLGVATINTSLELGGELLLAKTSKLIKNLPVLKRILNPKNIRAANPTTMGALDRLGKLAQGFASEGGTEAAQEVMSIFTDKLGQTWDGKETSLVSAMDRTLSELGTVEGAKRVAKSGTIGGIAGSGASVAYQGMDAVHQKVKDKIKNKSKAKDIVTPKAPEPVVANESSLPVNDPNPPLEPVAAPSVPQNLNPQEALTFALSIQGVVDGVNDTTLGKKAPTEAVKTQAQMIRDSGVDTLWMSSGDVNKWADNEQKAQFIREKFGLDALENIRLGSAVPIDPEIAVQMIRMDGKSAKAFRKDPSAMSVNEIAELYKQGSERAQTKLQAEGTAQPTEAPVAEGSSQPAAIERPTVNLGMASTDEDIVAALGNRQEANSYLERLTQEEETLSANEQLDFETPGRLQAITAMRERVKALSEGLPDQESGPASDIELTPQEEADAAFGSFMADPVLTDLIRAGMPRETVKTLESEYQRVRKEIVAATQEAADKEMLQVRDVVETMAAVDETIPAIEDSLSDPRIETVEIFLNNRKNLQIDPETLTPTQRARFIDDEALIQRKVFKKGGKTIDDVATELAVGSSDELLKILSSVPDMATATQNAITATDENLSIASQDSVEINSTAIIKALEDKQKLNLQIIRNIAESSWSKGRKIIEGTVFAKPNLDQIRQDAKTRIERTRVQHLNPKVYERGSKIAAKKAVKAANRGNFIEASQQREIEIKNDELLKQTYATTAKTNRLIKNIATMMRSPGIQKKLKNANMQNAFAEFSSIINLEPKRQAGKKNAFAKLVKKLEGDQLTMNLAIPQELVQGFDPRATLKELSYEQISYIEGKMREMVKLAEATNIQTRDDKTEYNKQVAKKLIEEAKLNPDHDLDRAKPEPVKNNALTAKNALAKVYTFADKANASMINIKSITNSLTRGKTDTFTHSFIFDQIEGVGNYKNGFGNFAAKLWRTKITKRLRELETKYGKERLDSYGYTWVKAPESFKDSVGLLDANGYIQQRTLLTIVAYYGSKTGRQRLENFKVDMNALWEFTTSQLVDQDFEYIQEVQDTFDLLRPQIKRTLEMTSGEDVQWVEGEGFEVNGKWYRGGYIPLKYQRDLTIEQQSETSKNDTAIALGQEKNQPLDISTTKAFTKQGHLETRVRDYTGVLQTDFALIVSQGFEQVITDTTMYVPIYNIMNTLNDPEVATNIAAVVGKTELKVLKNHIIDAGKNITVERIQNFQELESFNRLMFNRLVANAATNQLLLIPKVFANQLASGFYMWREGGIRSTGTYLSVVVKTLLNPRGSIQIASEILPSIGDFRHSIDERSFGSIYQALPQEGRQSKVGRGAKYITEGIRKINFDYGLGGVDTLLKTNATLTLMTRFLEGKVKGFDADKLASMNDQEKFNAMQSYVVNTLKGTATAAEQIDRSFIQKSPAGKAWAVYFNDVRNNYNYTMFNLREWKREVKEAKKAMGEGDYSKARNSLIGVGTSIATYQIFNAMMLGYMNAVKGRDDDENEMQGILSYQWEKSMASDFFENLFNPMAPVKTISDSLPIVRDIKFTWNMLEKSDGRYKQAVQPMELRAFNNVIEGTFALKQLTYDSYILGERFSPSQKKQFRRSLIQSAGSVIPLFPSNLINRQFKEEKFKDTAFSDPGILMTAPALIYEVISGSSDLISIKPTEAGAEEITEALEEIKTMIDPNNAAAIQLIKNGEMAVINQSEWDTIKMIESGNDPSAYNEASGAAGLFQFIPKTWSDLQKKHPGLGLTDEGRFDAAESELAMSQLLIDNATTLLRNKVPVNVETLYTAHHFGDSRASKIWNMPDSASLESVIPQSFRDANPWLDGFGGYVNGARVENNYGITERVETVGDFKEAIRKIIQYGQDAVAFEAELKGTQ